jgi:molybdate transport system substrate-binding protein
VVQAAASLTDAFNDLAADFEALNPGAQIILNLAGSQSLATQIIQGAPADVFASANLTQMDRISAEGLVQGSPSVFAANQLTIVVEVGNPLDIRTLADLANPELILVLAAPEVPAGDFAATALEAAGITVTPASLEVDVRSALSKVQLGEADASIVYTTDVRSSGTSVQGVPIPPELNIVAQYPIAVLTGAPNPEGAQAFVDYVASEQGQAMLGQYGFQQP